MMSTSRAADKYNERSYSVLVRVLGLESRIRFSDHQYTEPRTVSFVHVRFENQWADDTAPAWFSKHSMTDTARLKQTFGQLILCLCYPSKHVNVGPTCVSHGLQGYRVGMGSKWASYLGPTWVTQLGPTWVNPGGHLIWGPLGWPS